MVTLLLLGAGVAGCATSEGNIKDARNETRTTERSSLREFYDNDKHDLAISGLTSAAAGHDPDDAVYLDSYLYVDHARQLGSIGMIELRQGNPRKAREYFAQSTSVMNNGFTAHKSILESRTSRRDAASAVFAVGTVVGAALLGAGGDIEDAIAGIGDMPASDLEKVLEAAGGTVESIFPVPTDIPVAGGVERAESDQFFRTPAFTSDPVISSVNQIVGEDTNCSAVRLSKRILATSAHCFYDNKFSSIKIYSKQISYDLPESFINPRGYSSSYVRASGSDMYRHSLYDPDTTKGRWHDIAILVDEDGVGSKRALSETSALYPKNAQDRTGLVVGFSGDLSEGRYRQLDFGCQMRNINTADDHPVYRTNCVGYKGNSGGALYAGFPNENANSEDRFALIGINSFSRDVTEDEFENASISRERLSDPDFKPGKGSGMIAIGIEALRDPLMQVIEDTDNATVKAEAEALLAQL